MGEGSGPTAAPGAEVRLEVPATADLLRLVRVTASGIASRLGWSVDAIEDVRLAVDELCWAVAGRAAAEGRLAVRLRVADDGDGFTVEGRLRGGGAAPARLSVVSERILETLVDAYALLPAGGDDGPGFTMTVSRGPSSRGSSTSGPKRG